MRFGRVLAIFAIIGILVPFFFLLNWAFDGPDWVLNIQLYFWPASILYLATDGVHLSQVAGVMFGAVLVLLNVPLYLLYGTLVWFIFRAAALLRRESRSRS